MNECGGGDGWWLSLGGNRQRKSIKIILTSHHCILNMASVPNVGLVHVLCNL